MSAVQLDFGSENPFEKAREKASELDSNLPMGLTDEVCWFISRSFKSFPKWCHFEKLQDPISNQEMPLACYRFNLSNVTVTF